MELLLNTLESCDAESLVNILDNIRKDYSAHYSKENSEDIDRVSFSLSVASLDDNLKVIKITPVDGVQSLII